MAERIGERIGNYYLTELLGSGGFAETYLGEHAYLKTYAAIKILQAQLGKTELESFHNEARIIARLKHPNIVRVLEFGVEGNTPYLVMEYAQNGTLRQFHPRGMPLPLHTIMLYVRQIAAALQHAHDQRLIHRDVKPENILLGEQNEILLGDFGIAVIAQTYANNLQNIAGTVTYMAPEQIQGKPRPASDQYALAIIVYEWLCGIPPFSGTYTEVALQHECVAPLPLHEQITIAPKIEEVVLTALAKDAQQRYSSIQAFANALEEASTQHLLYNYSEADLLAFESSPTDPRIPIATLAALRPSPLINTVAHMRSMLQAEVQLEQKLPTTPSPPALEQPDFYQSRREEEDPSLTDDAIPIPEDGQACNKAQVIQQEMAEPVTPMPAAIEQDQLPAHIPSSELPAKPIAPTISGKARLSSAQTRSPDLLITSAHKLSSRTLRLLVILVTILIGGGSLIYAAKPSDNPVAGPRNVVQGSSIPGPAALAATQATMKTMYNEITSDPTTITDPLTNPDNFGWDNAQYADGGNKNIGRCIFENGTYHDSSTPGYFINCMATATNFANVAYQAEMIMLSGHSGGLVIRGDTNDSGYYFRISTDGTYIFQKIIGDNNGGTIQRTLASGNSAAIRTGLHQSNLLMIIAQGDTFYLFVNKQYVDAATDKSYAGGQIGVYTDSDAGDVEAIFSNVQVWKF